MSLFQRRTVPFSAERIEWTIEQPYPKILAKLGTILNKPRLLKMALLLKLHRRDGLKKYLDEVAGDIGLMLLGTVPHGRLLGLFDGPAEAQMFLIGNPLIALSMMRVHPQAGVYAPLRVMFSGTDSGKAVVTYDQPSTMFGQWGEPVFEETGKMLDEKMHTLIQMLIK